MNIFEITGVNLNFYWHGLKTGSLVKYGLQTIN